MKFRLLLLGLSWIIFSNNLSAQDYNEIDFSIIFGDFFHNDTISLSVNDLEYIKSAVITSDFSDGVTGVSLIQDEQKFVVNLGSHKTAFEKIEINDSLKIKVIIKGQEEYTNSFQLQNGKIIVFNNSKKKNVEGKIIKSLNALQYKQNIQFD